MTYIQLDNYLIHPALSGVLSFSFLFGVFYINQFIYTFFKLKDDLLIKICSFYTLLGFLASITLFIVLLELINNSYIISLYYAICVSGMFYIFSLLLKIQPDKYIVHKTIFIKNNNYILYYLTLAILAFYFILSITPVTDADSLAYHIGVPLDIIRKGGLYYQLEWKHSRVIGLGEFINLIGLIIKTDNIGACLNFLSLCLLLLITYNYTSNINRNILITLAVLSTPIFLQLIPSQKPQLYGICAIVIPVLAILKNNYTNPKYLFVIIGSIFFGMSLKYSFYISGGASLLFTLYVLKYKFSTFTILSTALYFIFIFPIHYTKYKYFGDPISPILSIFNNNPLEYHFYSELKSGIDGFGMPLGLFIPKTIGNLSTVIGFGILALLGIEKINSQSKLYFIYSAILSFIIFVIGQNVSRSFIEPLIIIYFAIFITISLESKICKYIKTIILFQLVFIFFSTLAGVYTLSPSLLSNQYRKYILSNTAHNYSVMSWVNEVIPKNSCIISDFHSNAITPRENVDKNYVHLLSYGYSKKNIFNNCKKYKNIFLVTHSKISNNHSLYNYIIYPAYSKNNFLSEFRNPITTGSYSGYIYMVNKSSLFMDHILYRRH